MLDKDYYKITFADLHQMQQSVCKWFIFAIAFVVKCLKLQKFDENGTDLI